MNRKKKIKQILTKKAKKKNAKQQNTNKPKYISKAERAELEAQEAKAPEIPELEVEAESENGETQKEAE